MSEEELVKWITRLQRQVDGLIKPEVGRWVTWTPTVTQSSAITITINHAVYLIASDQVDMMLKVTCTSAGVAGNAVIIGNVPAAIGSLYTDDNAVIGTAYVLDAGTTIYTGVLVPVSSAVLFGIRVQGGTNFLGVNPAYTIANTDEISFIASYRR